jgi:hypothetical protein
LQGRIAKVVQVGASACRCQQVWRVEPEQAPARALEDVRSVEYET